MVQRAPPAGRRRRARAPTASTSAASASANGASAIVERHDQLVLGRPRRAPGGRARRSAPATRSRPHATVTALPPAAWMELTSTRCPLASMRAASRSLWFVSQPRPTTSAAPTFGFAAVPMKANCVWSTSAPTSAQPCWCTIAHSVVRRDRARSGGRADHRREHEHVVARPQRTAWAAGSRGSPGVLGPGRRAEATLCTCTWPPTAIAPWRGR